MQAVRVLSKLFFLQAIVLSGYAIAQEDIAAPVGSQPGPISEPIDAEQPRPKVRPPVSSTDDSGIDAEALDQTPEELPLNDHEAEPNQLSEPIDPDEEHFPAPGHNQDFAPEEGAIVGSGVPQAERDDPSEVSPAPEPPSPAIEADALAKPTVASIIEERRKARVATNPEPKIFGSYRLHIGVIKSTFNKQESYERHYNDTPFAPNLAVDYFFFNWYATFGLGFSIGYFKDDGRALIQSSDGTYAKDPNGETRLTLIPVGVHGVLQMTPFSAKWFVIDGWAGYERTYFQESRHDSEEGSTDASASTGSGGGIYVDSGWREALTTSVGLSIRIDALDPRASSSLETMGLRGIYLTPFVQVITPVGNSKFNLGRTGYGLAFSFETIY